MYARATMFGGGAYACESFWTAGMRRHEPFNAMSIASNMSHEQRHSEVDVPARKDDREHCSGSRHCDYNAIRC